jgi:hypothetical protein
MENPYQPSRLNLLDIVRNLSSERPLNVFKVYRHLGKMYRDPVDLASPATSIRPVN